MLSFFTNYIKIQILLVDKKVLNVSFDMNKNRTLYS